MNPRHFARITLLLFALISTLCIAIPGFADTIHLASGGKVVGKILGEDEDGIQIRTKAGTIIVPREDIESIERVADLKATFRRRYKDLSANDADGFYRLALWCKERKLHEEYRLALERAIQVDPDHRNAREELGYRRYGNRWLSPEQNKQRKGLVRYGGRWITEEEKSCLEAGLVKHKGRWVDPRTREKREKADQGEKPSTRRIEPARPKAGPALPTGLHALLKIAVKPSDPGCRAARERLARMGTVGRHELRKILVAEKEKKIRTIYRFFRQKKGDIRTKLMEMIKVRRRAALEFIMDPARYPEANHGAEAQPEVDRLVGALERAWSDPYREVLPNSKRLKVLMADLTRTAREFDRYLDEKKVFGDAEAEISKKIARFINMPDVPLDKKDMELKAENRKVLDFNGRAETSMGAEEWACVRATNRYRVMFGLPTLRVDERLVRAARKHSDEMRRLKYFDHNSPVPENATPAIRVKREGAKYSAENIAKGQKTGEETFRAWYNSSGHHRNILGEHKTIGIGRAGDHWTQEFGADDLEKNKKRR
jgi:hypothetical protein